MDTNLNEKQILNSSPNLGEVSRMGRSGKDEEAEKSFTQKVNNLSYLKDKRKSLRNNPTPAELKMWSFLKGKKLEDRKFRRQHSIGNYILDFYCPNEKIAIELDGEGHNNVNQSEYDNNRTLFLKELNIRVLRFENEQVFTNTERVLEAIKREFK